MIIETGSAAESGAETPCPSEPVEVRWVSRKVQPVVLFYVWLVFGAFMAVSQFVFHSTGAVKALALTAIAFTVSVLPVVLARVEFRATDAGVEKQPFNPGRPESYVDAFKWDELSHVVSVRNGFKYFKRMDEPNAVLRFLYTHFSDKYSGEIHVAAEDRARVKGLLKERGVAVN